MMPVPFVAAVHEQMGIFLFKLVVKVKVRIRKSAFGRFDNKPFDVLVKQVFEALPLLVKLVVCAAKNNTAAVF